MRRTTKRPWSRPLTCDLVVPSGVVKLRLVGGFTLWKVGTLPWRYLVLGGWATYHTWDISGESERGGDKHDPPVCSLGNVSAGPTDSVSIQARSKLIGETRVWSPWFRAKSTGPLWILDLLGNLQDHHGDEGHGPLPVTKGWSIDPSIPRQGGSGVTEGNQERILLSAFGGGAARIFWC